MNLTVWIIDINGLGEALNLNIEKGLLPTEIIARRDRFGTNEKDPPIRTPFWKFFIKAIDDFMLKLLLVCACINIGFEVGFAEPGDRSHGKNLLIYTYYMTVKKWNIIK